MFKTLFNKYSHYFIELTDEQKYLLEKYFIYLQEVAVPFKFIGHRDAEDIFVKNILDSLLPLKHSTIYDLFFQNQSDVKEKKQVILDLGSGAGLPGIPLSIVNQNSHFILLDSSQKRMNFVQEFIEKESLSNVETLCENIEAVSFDADIITFRAFQKPLTSFELSLRFVKENSKIVYYRSNRLVNIKNKVDSESKSQEIQNRMYGLGFHKFSFFELDVPLELDKRGVCLLEYSGSHEKKYPRKMKQIKRDVLNTKVI